ncbi:WD40 repeat domain-containing protein [Protofrankia coriariae]|uniref:WD40 repeat n=1 Tax=Protofrankia coriariae TaxID=1562887 RepID=A0ABR5F4W5_9ACTN|nr:WD40 repeat domain-containing protein [Protofrankia coriariae]KLL11673.1 hypothetical protein FrCorBMG51_09950 [Protofrankia coriariae]
MDEQRENGPTGQASTTPPVDAALRAWAVTHARTVGRTGDPARVSPLSDDARPTEAAPWRDEPWAPGDVAVAESSTTLTGGHTGPVMSVAWAAERDGRLLLATGGEDATARVWDPFTGTCLHTLAGHANGVWSVAWVTDSDGRLLLATGSEDTTVRVWDPFTGACLHTMTRRPTRSVMSVAWATGGDGRPLLAAGSRDATVQVWDTLADSCLRNLTGHTDGVNSVAWATGRDGQHLLASGGGYDRTVRVWDPLTGTCLHTLTGHTGGVDAVAWATGRDGRLLLASGGGDGTVRVWDPASGACLHTLIGHTDGVGSVAWAAGGDGRAPLLASGSFDGTVRVWDPVSGACLRTLTGYAGPVWSVAWAVGGESRLLLATGGSDAMVWAVEVPHPSASTSTTSSAPARTSPVGSSLRTAAAGLVLLGAGGLWPPLSLIADLITLTGGTTTGPAVTNGAPTAIPTAGRPPAGDSPGLYDPRLHVLASHPGIGRLRALAWPPAARVGLAALLAAALPADSRVIPPAGSTPTGQHRALTTALHSPSGSPAAPLTPRQFDQLAAAAARVTPRLAALLELIGPAAVATDPTLPLRVRDRALAMPPLPTRQHTLLLTVTALTTAGTGQAVTSMRAPGTTGITHHGTPRALLPTHHALPDDLFTLRLARGDLLYRHHTTTPTLPPQAVTIILDTSPPTYGPAETLLRLTAHLLTTVLWHNGIHPTLITFDQPALALPLTSPADLAVIWTSRTLHPPDLPAALRTAEHTSQPTTVLLTHHHLPDDRPLPLGPHLRLLTTHTPGDEPPTSQIGRTRTRGHTNHSPDGRYHHHLPPHPDPASLAAAIHALLASNDQADGMNRYFSYTSGVRRA